MHKKTFKKKLPLRCTIIGIGYLFIVLSLFTHQANAQIPTGFNDISLKASNETPRPFEDISLTLQSFSVDLNRAQIKWYLNNNLVSSGIGKTRYSFKTGGVGSVSKITASISTSSFNILDITATFSPSEIDILWEVLDGYSPPFYKGKTLPVSQSVIRASVISNFTKNTNTNPNSLIYKWKKNYKYRDLNNQSGYGKKTVIFRSELLRNGELLEVETSSANKQRFGKGRTIIPKYDTQIIFYENHPLEGLLYENSIPEEFSMKNKEVKIIAEPYFFSIGNGGFESLKFDWRLSGKKIESEEDKRVLILRNESGDEGAANISLNITHVSNVLQFARNIFRIEF